MSKNFLEILNELAAEQKQPFINHFVQTLLGKQPEPLIMAKSFTINGDLPITEQVRLFKEQYGVNTPDDMVQRMIESEKQIGQSKVSIRNIIGKSYEMALIDNDFNKADELMDLGKFLYTMNLNYQFEVNEKPDFKLFDDDLSIGLEHTRLISGSDRAVMKDLSNKYLKVAQKLLLQQFPDLTGLINITLDADLPIFEGKSLRDFTEKPIRKNKATICETIKAAMEAVIYNGQMPDQKFIKEIHYQPGKESFSIKHNQNYFTREDFEEKLIAAIKNKDQLLKAYKENFIFQKWWLLLTFSNSDFASGFKVKDNVLSKAISSSFDQIFVLNNYDLTCYELQDIYPYFKPVALRSFTSFSLKRDVSKNDFWP